MAAVAGSVAEEILAAMMREAPLDRAYVNNGGDIALHLAEGEHFTVGMTDRPDQFGVMRTMIIRAGDPSRGVATSGCRGRSFSLGIADAVTVLARTAAQADAANVQFLSSGILATRSPMTLETCSMLVSKPGPSR